MVLLALVESRKLNTAAVKTTAVTPMATINSTKVKPDCFFINLLLNPQSRELRDIANQRVLPVQCTYGVIHGDGDLPESRCARNVRNHDGPRHVPQGHHHIIGGAENLVRS